MLAQSQGVMIQCHNIPFGDTQDIEDEIIPPLFGSLETAREILQLYAAVIDTLEVEVDHLRERAIAGFTTVTELADTLVRECDLPFRQAHSVVSALVSYAREENLTAHELTADLLRRVASDQAGIEVALSDEGIHACAGSAGIRRRADAARRRRPKRHGQGTASSGRSTKGRSALAGDGAGVAVCSGR